MNADAPDASGATAPPAAPTPRRLPSRRRIWAARAIAVAADALQFLILPLLGVGFVSLPMDVMDVVVAIVLTILVGWHWAFLPAFVAEIVPGIGLIPTWTLAAWIATRKKS